MCASDKSGEHAVLVVHGEHDSIPEDVNERSPGGLLGEPGCLDLVVTIAKTAQVIRQSSPPAWRVPDVPGARGGIADATDAQVGRCPASGELLDVELQGGCKDRASPLGPFCWWTGCGGPRFRVGILEGGG